MKIKELIDKYYPPFSEERISLRKIWNAAFNHQDWELYLKDAALAADELKQFEGIAKKCTTLNLFITEAKKIKVDEMTSIFFRIKYSNTPFEDIKTVAKRFYDKHHD